MIVTSDLARRLEYAEAADAAGCVEAACRLELECDASAKAISGGFLTFCGVESPLTHGIGLGMNGPVTAAEMDEIEHFFYVRGAPAAIDVCPYADPSLREHLAARGYRVTDFTTILVRTLADVPPVPDAIPVRIVASHEGELYASTVTRGFFGRDGITSAEYRLGRMLFRMPCTRPLFAEIAGEVVSCGGISVRNGVANFFGDATLRAWRGRGAHSTLVAQRLRMANEAGCELAFAGTAPGGTSERNYQRLGFQVAFTKLTMVREF